LFRNFFLGRENGFAQRAEYFMPSASGETASRCGDCYAPFRDLSRYNRTLAQSNVVSALALATVLKLVLFLDQRQQPQSQEREHGNRYRDVVAAEPDGKRRSRRSLTGSRPSPCLA
jgi:hypothetical protein